MRAGQLVGIALTFGLGCSEATGVPRLERPVPLARVNRPIVDFAILGPDLYWIGAPTEAELEGPTPPPTRLFRQRFDEAAEEEILAFADPAPGNILGAADRIYFLAEGALLAHRPGAGTEAVLPDRFGPAALAHRDDTLYVLERCCRDQFLWSVRGASRTSVAPIAPGSYASDLVLDDSAAYWLERHLGSVTSTAGPDGVAKIALGGGSIARWEGSGIARLAAGGGSVYWRTDRQIFGASRDLGVPAAIADAGPLGGLAADDVAVYWTDPGTRHLYRLEHGSSSPAILANLASLSGDRLLADGENLFWVANGEIWGTHK